MTSPTEAPTRASQIEELARQMCDVMKRQAALFDHEMATDTELALRHSLAAALTEVIQPLLECREIAIKALDEREALTGGMVRWWAEAVSLRAELNRRTHTLRKLAAAGHTAAYDMRNDLTTILDSWEQPVDQEQSE